MQWDRMVRIRVRDGIGWDEMQWDLGLGLGLGWDEMQWDSGLRLVRYRFRFKLRSTFG